MTRGPAKQIIAFGSARMTSPKEAKLAVTPPVVGFVNNAMYGKPASSWRMSAPDVFAICMRLKAPSCMRAPPLAVTINSGSRRAVAVSISRVIFSPTADPTLYVPAGSIDAYKAAKYWKNFGQILPIQGGLQGDVNGDGVVNGSDVTALYNVLLDGATPAGDADVNGDGIVNGSDVTAIYNLLLN